MDETVLLTGSCGLIGKEAILPLIENGFNLISISRKTLKPIRKNHIHQVCDIFDYDRLKELFQTFKPKFLLHFAWNTSPGYLDSELNKKFLDSSLKMLELFSQNGGFRFVQAGTCFEYDLSSNMPLKETSKIGPKTLYAKTKYELFEKSKEFCLQNQISFAHGRIFYVFGRNEQPHRFIPTCIENISKNKPVKIKNQNTCLDYMYSKDIAEAFVQILKSNVQGPVNVGSSQALNLIEICEKIGKVLNIKPEIEINNSSDSSATNILSDTSLLKEKTSFRQNFSFEQGILDSLINRKFL